MYLLSVCFKLSLIGRWRWRSDAFIDCAGAVVDLAEFYCLLSISNSVVLVGTVQVRFYVLCTFLMNCNEGRCLVLCKSCPVYFVRYGIGAAKAPKGFCLHTPTSQCVTVRSKQSSMLIKLYWSCEDTALNQNHNIRVLPGLGKTLKAPRKKRW